LKFHLALWGLMKVLAVLGTICAIFAARWMSQTDCVVRRAAFDVGSGTTRMKIADVNTCKQIIENVIYEQQEKVDYKEDLVKSGDRFSTDIQAAGLAVIQLLKNKALENG